MRNNYIEWASSGDVTDPYGVFVEQSGSTAKIRQLVIRDNIIKRLDGSSYTDSERGIYLSDSAVWNNLMVDNNLLDIGTTATNGVSHPVLPGGATISPFNNRKSDNTFLPAQNRGTNQIDQELTTDVETLFIGL